MNEATKSALKQFIRNERWGTCGSCPKDSEGNVYPEFCIETDRYDHQLTLDNIYENYKKLNKK